MLVTVECRLCNADPDRSLPLDSQGQGLEETGKAPFIVRGWNCSRGGFASAVLFCNVPGVHLFFRQARPKWFLPSHQSSLTLEQFSFSYINGILP